MVARILFVTSWVVFLTGAAMLRADAKPEAAEAESPLPSAELVVDRESAGRILELESATGGEARVVLAVTLSDPARDGAELEARLAPEAAPLDLTVDVTVRELPDGETRSLAIEGSELAITSSLHREQRSLLLVAERTLTVASGERYGIEVRTSGADAGWLLGFRPLLLVEPRATTPQIRPRPDPAPGLLALIGAIGVCAHVWVLCGRLIVPMAEPLPSPGDEFSALGGKSLAT